MIHMAAGPPRTALKSSADLSMTAQGSVFCTDNTACFSTDSPNLSIVVGILCETTQRQPAAKHLGTCRNIPIYCSLPVFWLCIHNTIGTVTPASSLRDTEGKQRTSPSRPSSGFDVSQRKALPFCMCRHNLLYSSHKSHQHRPKT